MFAPSLLMAPRVSFGEPLDAPNVEQIGPLLATSGQPSEQALRTLASRGFKAVVYLAPSSVPNAVPNEAELLRAQAIEFVQIPIPFNAPDESHVQAFFSVMDRLKNVSTLVHCEISMRASVMVFLYRSIRRREDPAVAYEAVARVWSPRGAWRRLADQQLAKNGVRFDLY